MTMQRTPMARAILAAASLLPFAAFAQTAQQSLPAVVVSATPFSASEEAQILTPAKILAGSELRDKLGVSLGETLSRELGVSASAFGAGASRPIIRGLEGPRVKILQNGMSVADVSSLSNDHAVAADFGTARQIEILRGPAALLYGSGAIGGLVNVVNERIPTMLLPKATGEAELRASSADRGKALTLRRRWQRRQHRSAHRCPGARNRRLPHPRPGRTRPIPIRPPAVCPTRSRASATSASASRTWIAGATSAPRSA